MKYYDSPEEMPVGEIEHENYEDDTVHHLVCENSRRHVLYYDSKGVHCKHKKCEINGGKEKKTK